MIQSSSSVTYFFIFAGILFQIGITSPNPPTEPFINATVDYVAWLFNVSSNNVSINVTQGEQPNEYVLNVSVQGESSLVHMTCDTCHEST